jgi:tRNA A58 N-methylase Trm61
MNLSGVGSAMLSVGVSQEKQGNLLMYSQRQDNFSLHKLNLSFLIFGFPPPNQSHAVF